MPRAILAYLIRLGERDWQLKMNELRLLAKTAGYEIVAEITQKRPAPVSATLFGKGKVEEIARACEEHNADALIVWNVLTPIQKFNLELAVKREVKDRYDLVLEVFEAHATDAVSKLQIEMARLRKMLPYYKLWVKLRKMGEHQYAHASGMYGWERAWRDVKARLSRLKDEIETLRKQKLQHFERRKRQGFKVATFVGYFNAGKSSLFNALSRTSKAEVSPAPFTTLASKFANMPGAEKLLLMDTIGFSAGLDPRIIHSFAINVDEMRHADVIVWVVDVSDPYEVFEFRTRAAAETMRHLKLFDKPHVVAANKIDALSNRSELEEKIEYVRTWTDARVIPCSAKTGEGLADLAREIVRLAGLSAGS